MHQPRVSGFARQFAVIFTAIFQVYAAYIGGQSTGAIAQEFRSLILPATYAFAIWGPIFILCAVYAVYQALPGQRENPVFRAIGWWTAGAFLANGVWIYVYDGRMFVLAQLVIFASFVCAGMAYLRFAREAPATRVASIDNWLVGPTLGLLFGWITAANVVSVANTLVSQGFAPVGQGAAVGGAALLLFGGAVAFFVILSTKTGAAGGWIAYGAAVIWALVAVAVEHWGASLLTASAAVIAAILVLVAMVGPWSGGPLRLPSGRAAAARGV
jgi:hypothetical protein